MGKKFVFAGPDYDYTVELPDALRFEDEYLLVSGPEGDTKWSVETEETGADDIVTLSGMTRGAFQGLIGDKDALWFQLRLDELAEIQYWADRVMVRADYEQRGR